MSADVLDTLATDRAARGRFTTRAAAELGRSSGPRDAPAPEAQGRGAREAAQRPTLGKTRKSADAPFLATGSAPDAIAVAQRHAGQDETRRMHATLRETAPDGQAVTTLPGVYWCGVAPRNGSTAVGARLRQRADGSRCCSLVDVQSCHSIACPRCLPLDAAADTRELEIVTRHVIDSGGSVLHMVLTAQHGRDDALADTIERVTEAFGHVTESRQWRDVKGYGVRTAVLCEEVNRRRLDGKTSDGRFRRALKKTRRDRMRRKLRGLAEQAGNPGRLWGWVRALEITHGEAAGWHPHLHVLVFLRGKVTEPEAEALRVMVTDVYRAGLRKNGGDCADEYGVRVEVATTRRDAAGVLSRYLTKIALEITRGDRKEPKVIIKRNARGNVIGTERRLNPYDMLRLIAADPEFTLPQTRRLVALWREFEGATKGRARITHGGEWRELLAAAVAAGWEDTLPAPEEDAPAPLPDGSPVTESTPDTVEWSPLYHRRVMRVWPDLAAAGERDGWPALLAGLDALGVPWRWRPVLTPDDDPRPNVRRRLAR